MVELNKKVGICIVLYNPDIAYIVKGLQSLVSFVNHIVLIDNSEKNNGAILETFNHRNIQYYNLGSNQGIAKAQNIGIRKLLKLNIDDILFLDQDSHLEKESFYELLKSKEILEKQHFKIGGIGPKPINERTNEEYSGRIIKGKPVDDSIYEFKELISSGTLISKGIFQDVGLFEESLFIDGVDHEWCWRASKRGYRFFICTLASLNHNLGEGDKKILGINFKVPKPIRTYYQYRNFFRLIKRGYVPVYWKISNLVKYIIKAPVYILLFENKKEYLFYISKGVFDGFFHSKKSSIAR